MVFIATFPGICVHALELGLTLSWLTCSPWRIVLDGLLGGLGKDKKQKFNEVQKYACYKRHIHILDSSQAQMVGDGSGGEEGTREAKSSLGVEASDVPEQIVNQNFLL